jgi:FkbM family methyltransferase
MKIFGREHKRFIAGIFNLHLFFIGCWRSFFVFNNPLKVIYLYLIRRSPSNKLVQLRNGFRIFLSDDSADIVTIFLIFARLDYGKIKRDSTVVDIGANIGVFTLFAAASGARKIYAYEPSISSFELLLKNIDENNLGYLVKPENAAVVGKENLSVVRFPKKSNVMNAILIDPKSSKEYDLIRAISIKDVLLPLPKVDLVKSDCEGGEFDIFLNGDQAVLAGVLEIRMEIHVGDRKALIDRLVCSGFNCIQYMNEKSGAGYLQMKR